MPGTDPTTLTGFQRYWNAEDATDSGGYTNGGATAPTGFRRNLSLAIRSGVSAATLTDASGGVPGTPQLTIMGGTGIAFDPSYNFNVGGMANVAIAANQPSRANYTIIVVMRAPISHGGVATPSSTSFAQSWPASCGRNIWQIGSGNHIASAWCDERRRVLSYNRDAGGTSQQAISGFTAPASRQIFLFEGNGTTHLSYVYRRGLMVQGAAANIVASGTAGLFYAGYGGASDYAFRGIIERIYAFSGQLSSAEQLAACQFIDDEYTTAGFPVKHSPTTKLTIVGDSIAGGAHGDRCENWVNMLDQAVGSSVLVDLQAIEGQDVTGFSDATFYANTIGNADNDNGFAFSRKVALIALGANWLRQSSGSRPTAAAWIADMATLVTRLRGSGYSQVFAVVPIAIGNATDPNAQETLRLGFRTQMLSATFLDGVIDTLGTVFHPRAATVNAVGQCVAGAAYQLAFTEQNRTVSGTKADTVTAISHTTGLTLDGMNDTLGSQIGIDGIHIGPIGQLAYFNMVRSNARFARAVGLVTGGGARRLRMGTRR